MALVNWRQRLEMRPVRDLLQRLTWHFVASPSKPNVLITSVKPSHNVVKKIFAHKGPGRHMTAAVWVTSVRYWDATVRNIHIPHTINLLPVILLTWPWAREGRRRPSSGPLATPLVPELTMSVMRPAVRYVCDVLFDRICWHKQCAQTSNGVNILTTLVGSAL